MIVETGSSEDRAGRPVVGVVSADSASADACADVLERSGARAARLATARESREGLQSVDAVVFAGDQDRAVHGDLLTRSIDAGMAVLCISGGLWLLNEALGGQPPGPVDGHGPVGHDRETGSAYHRIFIAPGSKLAAVVGSGGIVRVNSRHGVGIRPAHKSPLLLASAYSLQDGVIEALESAEHRWVIGVQFQPEIRGEMPPHFDRLFQSLVDRARERPDSVGLSPGDATDGL